MKRCMTLIVVVCMPLLAVDPKQAGTPQTPELKQLNSFAGQWDFTGVNRMTGQKFTSTVDCGWDKSGKVLLCDEQWQYANSAITFGHTLNYDRKTKTYAWATVSSEGYAAIVIGVFEDGKWTLARDGDWNSKPARYEVQRVVDDAAGTAVNTWRVSVSGGPWVVLYEGKGTRRPR